MRSRDRGKPYVCVFIGVNGVGKFMRYANADATLDHSLNRQEGMRTLILLSVIAKRPTQATS